jgi:protein-S-isoprenylcysteine O-methyltransferase Ste14
MTIFVAKLMWALGLIGCGVVRQTFARRSSRVHSVERRVDLRERVLLVAAFLGLFLVPAIYALTGQPRFADYPFQPLLAWLGIPVFALALWLFYRSHKDLGRNWSVTLEVRERHSLVTHGVYARVRHPMYAAFWLWALAQALLLPNWVAGPAGLAGFGLLYFGRVAREEAMLIDHFGDDYRRHMARTARIIPGVY